MGYRGPPIRPPNGRGAGVGRRATLARLRMERFAHFEIVRPLGVGGMAETALALRRGADEFEQRVCLKRILPAFSKDAEFVRAFQNEARLGMRLVHPHVCRLYDFGNHEGTFWMSMEFLDGGDLRSLLENLSELGQPIPIDVVLLLALDIASALHYAHELRVDGKPQEIVHRDISPSNVLIDSTGHFKLADFGIAKASASGEVTRTGVVKGKIPYMAPEHARGMKIDARADLWSFGVLLYESLAGERPFRGSHEVETLLAVTEGRRKKLLEVAPHTPPILASVVEKLLEPDLDKRIRRAADVIEALASTPPPANARLRLSSLIQRVADDLAKTDQRAVGEAATAFAPDGSTSAAPEPTVLGRDGVSVGRAAQPVSAPSNAETRAATPALPAMDTQAIAPASRPKRTIEELNVPTGVREAAAQASAIDDALSTDRLVAQGALKSLTDTEAATPFAGASSPAPVRRTAQFVIAFALMGMVGLGLAAWGLGGARRTPEGRTSMAAGGLALGGPALDGPAGPPVVSVPVAPPSVPSVPVIDAVPGALPSGPPEEALAIVPSSLPAEVPVEAPVEVPVVEGAAVEGPTEDAVDERATLVMAATPWGNIWLDGRRLGMGPVTRRVAPGRHVVGAGRDRPTTTRTVHLERGGRLEVALRVAE